MAKHDLRNNEQLLAEREIPVTFWVGFTVRCASVLLMPAALLDVCRVLTNSFVVTNKRVFGKVGLFGTSEYDIALDKVNSVKSHQGIIGKIFNYGHIEVTDSSSDSYFILCASPTKLKKQIFEIQDKFKEEQIVKMAKAVAS